jgi:hypothetical protein
MVWTHISYIVGAAHCIHLYYSVLDSTSMTFRTRPVSIHIGLRIGTWVEGGGAVVSTVSANRCLLGSRGELTAPYCLSHLHCGPGHHKLGAAETE